MPRSPDVRALLPIALALGLAGALYYGTIWWWVFEWTRAGSFYAHGIFIPFFVGLMIWHDRERLRRLPMGRSWWGLVLVAAAVGLVLLSARAQVTVPISFSFILLLIGTTLLAAGKAMTRALLFPMLFLFTMIPVVPDQLINPIAFPIQMTSAKMAASICNLIGVPALRTGTQIRMEHFPLDVELPCSGFKTLLGLLAFSAAFAYLVQAAPWKRWTLFMISAPLAILVNGVRITLIGLAGELLGSSTAHAFHDYSGFIVLILGFIGLFSLARVLRCESFLGAPLTDPPAAPEAEPPGEGRAEEKEIPPSGARSPESRTSASSEALDALYGPPRAGSLRHLARGLYPVVVVLATAYPLQAAIHPRGVTIPALTSAQLPRTLRDGTWAWSQQGSDAPIAREVQAVLNPLSYIDRQYMRIRGAGAGDRTAWVEMLLTAGNARRVFHDPHTCFLGTGYFLRDVRVRTIDTPCGPISVQEAEAEETATHTKSLMMFCYVVDGRQVQTTQAVNLALVWQLLAGDSGRPSYFLRFRQLTPGVDEARRQELIGFIRVVWPEIAPAAVGLDNLVVRHARGSLMSASSR